MNLQEITKKLVRELEQLQPPPPHIYVYNPLVYARAAHNRYLKRFGQGQREIVLLGINPGPWGMAQCGVPFGDVQLVRKWMKIDEPVGKPEREHPKYPVQGFAYTKRETSGRRFLEWASAAFVTPEKFFKRFFVTNHCPLCFIDGGGEKAKNITPNKLPKEYKEPLLEVCDEALRRTIDYLHPDHVIGVGKDPGKCARRVLDETKVKIGSIPHPSPLAHKVNRNWDPAAVAEFLNSCGIKL